MPDENEDQSKNEQKPTSTEGKDYFGNNKSSDGTTSRSLGTDSGSIGTERKAATGAGTVAPAVGGGSKRDLALLTAAHAETHVQTAAYSVLYPYIMQSLNFGVVELGALISASSLVGGLLQGIHGWLSRWVKRKALCGAGNIFVGLSLALAGLASNFPFFGAARVGGSVAASPQHPVAASLMSDWYGSRKRGTSFSMHFAGGNVGTVVAPLAAGFLYVAVGWRNTLLLFGIPGIVIGSLVWIFLNDQRKAGTWYSSKSPKGAESEGQGKRLSYLSVVHNTNALKLMLARATTSVGRGLGIILTYVQLYFVKELGFSAGLSTVLITILTAGSVISPLLGGRLADTLGLRRPIIIASLASGALSLGLLIESGKYVPAVAISVVMLGLSVYNEGPLSQALLSEIVSDQEREGAYSLYFVISYAGSAMWGFVIAYVIFISSFATAFEMIMAANVAAIVIYSLVKERDFRKNDIRPLPKG